MTTLPRASAPDSGGFSAYERSEVESFFASALDERMRLMGVIAAARRRIAEAKASLADATDTEYSCIRTVLEAQRRLRGEQRANEKAIAAIDARAEVEAERILLRAREQAAEMTALVRRSEGPGGQTGRRTSEFDAGPALRRFNDVGHEAPPADRPWPR